MLILYTYTYKFKLKVSVALAIPEPTSRSQDCIHHLLSYGSWEYLGIHEEIQGQMQMASSVVVRVRAFCRAKG